MTKCSGLMSLTIVGEFKHVNEALFSIRILKLLTIYSRCSGIGRRAGLKIVFVLILSGWLLAWGLT
jgi:hypothetical protein